MAKTVFNRYEKKYIIPESIYAEFIRRLSEKMTQDKYGLHTICNIYYDTPDYLLIRRSMEHHTYKEKLRLRSYGIPDKNSVVFLEIKKKYRRIVNKRRVSMTLSSAYKYTGEKHDIKQESGNLILDEINYAYGVRFPENTGVSDMISTLSSLMIKFGIERVYGKGHHKSAYFTS